MTKSRLETARELASLLQITESRAEDIVDLLTEYFYDEFWPEPVTVVIDEKSKNTTNVEISPSAQQRSVLAQDFVADLVNADGTKVDVPKGDLAHDIKNPSKIKRKSVSGAVTTEDMRLKIH